MLLFFKWHLQYRRLVIICPVVFNNFAREKKKNSSNNFFNHKVTTYLSRILKQLATYIFSCNWSFKVSGFLSKLIGFPTNVIENLSFIFAEIPLKKHYFVKPWRNKVSEYIPRNRELWLPKKFGYSEGVTDIRDDG